MDLVALLNQLNYEANEVTLAQIKRVLNNSNGVEPENIITLNDHLKPHRCFVAMSGSEDYFKIKNIATAEGIKAEVEQIIQNWANKHKFSLRKVNDTTHYILGKVL
ncbi:type II secretion system protein [Campylobacter sp. RM16191]|uniref:type II secretion system protein n=1 Tax=Campylobacter sp. RM16191 TaxID=1705728 RepID=UPI001473847F|nr:type II secretion system protein [Campylobacter sp. RM16191]